MKNLTYLIKVYYYKILKTLVPKPSPGFRKILVVRFGGVNQGILSLGYLKPLQDQNPLLQISVLGDNLSLRFIRPYKEFTCYPLDEIEGKNTLEKVHLFSKRKNFDMIFLAYPFNDKNLLTYLKMHFKCPIIGFHMENVEDNLDHTFFLQNQHVIEENLIAFENIFNLKLPRNHIQIRYPFFYKNKKQFDPNSYHLGIFPLSKSCLDEEKLKSFFDKFMNYCLQAQPRTRIHLFGNKEFANLFNDLKKDRDWVEEHFEVTSWEDISIIINRLDFFVGFDSPFIEIANAHRIPHVILDDPGQHMKYLYAPWLNECSFQRVSIGKNLDDSFSPLVEAWSSYHKMASDSLGKLDQGLKSEFVQTKEM